MTAATLANGYTLTTGQENDLLDSLSLGPVSFSSVDGSGSVDWTYSVTNGEIDFLGDGDSVTLTFTVEVDDQNGGTDTQDVVIVVQGTNDVPIIDSAPQAGTVTETVDAAPGVDADPANATGTITFDDADLSDDPTATIVSRNVTAATLANGYTLTTGQENDLLDSLSLGPVSFSSVDGSGSVDWTYSVTNGEIDFLGDGDSVTLTFTVEVDDQNGGTDTQDVVIVVEGTNDVPIIDSAAQTGTVTETVDAAPGVDADPTDATGTITFDDADLSDDPTATIVSGNVTAATLANGYTLTTGQENDLLDSLSLGPVSFSSVDGSGSVDWTYSVTNGEIGFLGDGDSVTLTFTVEVDDQNGGTDTQDVVIVVEGTNDAPIIDSAAQTGTVTETVDAAPGVDADPTDATGTITFDDADLSDDPTATIVSGNVTAATLANGYTLTTGQENDLLDSLSLGPVSFSSVDGQRFGRLDLQCDERRDRLPGRRGQRDADVYS